MSRIRTLTWFALLLGATLVVALLYPGVALAADGHIQGVVTADEGGGALDGITVVPCFEQGPGSDWYEEDWGRAVATAGGGLYDLTLPPGTWRLRFVDPSNTYGYQYWPNEILPFVGAHQDVVVGDGETVTDKNESMPLGGMIVGTVVSSAGPLLPDIDVTACADVDGRWMGVTGVRTDSNGDYALDGLPPGYFKLRFEDNVGHVYASEFFMDVLPWRYDQANWFQVDPDGYTSGILAILDEGVHLSGTLNGSAPIPWAGVGLAVQGDGGNWEPIHWTQPDGSGAWSIDGFPAGTYRLQFSDVDGEYVGECWENKPFDFSQGDDIVLAAGASGVYDADLDSAAHITGTVYGAGVGVLADINVSANVFTGEWYETVAWDTTEPDGTYDLGGLAGGAYLVQFSGGSHWVSQIYNGVSAWEDGTPVDVAGGTTQPGIDATLDPAAHIAGTVTGSGGPLENIQVVPMTWRDDGGGGGWWEHRWELSASTDALGGYDIGGLAGGTYRLMFTDPSGTWATEFFDDSMTTTAAHDVALASGGSFVANAELAEAGRIAGRVTSDGLNGIEGIQVGAGPFDVGAGFYEHIGWAQTDANGDYTIGGLPAGTYRVQFWDNTGLYVGETYDDQTDWTLGTDVQVTSGTTQSGIDAELVTGARISGTVTGEGFGPLESIQVVPMHLDGYDDWGNPWWNHRWDRSVVTWADGTYEVTGLEAGTWSVMFFGGDSGWATEYWDNAFSQNAAAHFDLALGEEALNVNAELTRAGSISGTVAGMGVDPPSVEGLQVVAVDPTSGEHIAWGQTGADGSYHLTGVLPGSYLVWCQDSWDWVGEWWQEVANQDAATPVEVLADQDTSGIDFTLDPACKISGTVTPEGGGSFGPAGSVNAVAMQWMDDGGGGGWWEQRWDIPGGVNEDGTYTIGGLAPGTYRVLFAGDSTLWATEYWNDKPSPGQGDDIVLGPGETRTGIDAVLSPASTISGRVTGDGAPDGIPYATISVAIFDPATEYWEEIAWEQADEFGYYTVWGLPAGDYAVSFGDQAGMWLYENYDDVYDWHEATPVHTDPVTPAENIDAVLASAAYISGTVYGEGEVDPLPWIGVDVFEGTDWGTEWLGGVQTDENGQYLFGGLWGSDRYLLQFTDWSGEWATEAYADASSWMWGDEVGAWPGMPAGGIDVTLERAGMIVGMVYGGEGTGNPLPNAAVAVGPYDAASDQWDGWFGYSEVYPDGSYVIRGLKPGAAYRVMAWDMDGIYAASFYDGGDGDYHSGTDIYPISGDSVTADFHLPAGAHITGAVTDGTDPIEGIAVFLYHEDPWSGFDDFWSSFDGVQASTDSLGQYDVGGLSPGNYRIGFGDMAHALYAGEIWDDAPLLAMGDTITITDYGEVVGGKDAVLGLGGSIEGTVTDNLGNPLQGVWVSASIMRGEGWWDSAEGWGAESDEFGRYVINAGLRPEDAFYVQAQPWDGNWLGEWWQESPDFASATAVHVPAGGSLTGIDFTLDPAAHIIGMVEGDDGTGLNGLPNIDVAAYAFTGEWWDWVGGSTTDMLGDYDIGGLKPDVEHRLWFMDWNGVWGAEAFSNKSSWMWGDPVTPSLVGPTVVDAQLVLGGTISGHVLGDGVPLTNAAVVAGPYDLATEQWDPWAWDDTDAEGFYELRGLAPGIYKVQAWDNDGFYAGTFWVDEGMNWADGLDVSVTSSLTTTADFDLHLAGQITGEVTDGLDPIAGIPVFLFAPGPYGDFDDFWTSFQGQQGTTDENGLYRIGGLLPGEYRIGFGDNGGGYAGEFWNDAPVLPMGQTITIDTYGEHESGKDAVLAIAGKISGHVYDDGSQPLAGIEIGGLVKDSTGQAWGVGAFGSATSDADGYYEIVGLHPGHAVYVETWAPDESWARQFYDGVYDLASATGVYVPEGGTRPDVDFTMQPAGFIGGHIELENPGIGSDGIGLTVYRDVGGAWEWANAIMGGIDAPGDWLLGGQAPGEYYVCFRDGSGLYASEYWDDAIIRAEADPITVVQGGTAIADCYLELAGGISGTVTSSAGALQGIDVSVLAWDTTAMEWVVADEWVTQTDVNGEYSLSVRSGTYRVEFRDASATYLTQYYSGAESALLGDDVVVTAPDETTGIDAVMQIDNDPPVADAGGPYAGGEGVPINFDGSASHDPNAPADDIVEYEWDLDGDWDFDDASGETTPVVFANDGIYEIALRVTDSYGLTDEDTATVTVANADPVVEHFDPGSDPFEGQVFTYSSTFTDAGVDDTHIATIDWGDGTPVAPVELVEPAPPVAGTLTAEHAYGDNGTYGVTVTVEDDDSGTGTDTFSVTVTNVAPTLGLIGVSDASPDVGQSISFGVEFEDPGALDTHTAVWDWGDGATSGPAAVSGGLATASHTYDSAGTFTASCTVTDSDGDSDTADTEVIVGALNTRPVAVDDAYTMAEDTVLTVPAPGVLGNDTDADSDALTASFDGDATHGEVTLNADGSFTYTPDADWFGIDSFDYVALDGNGGGDGATVTITVTDVAEPPTGLTVTPIAGANRIGTAIAASVEAFPAGADTVVIATAFNWPDALGGASLAGAVDGPILLTSQATLPGDVLAEIDRLGATKAYILGGTAAVGTGVETTLKGALGSANVTRLAGAGRYETARKIAAECVRVLGAGYDGTAFAATGLNFPDALGASPLAAANGWPIYLVGPTGADSTLVGAMRADGVEKVLVLGGTGVVSEAVKNGLAAGIPAASERLFGANRYATACAVATYGVNHAGLGWDALAIATGQNFPDALAGGVLQGKSGSVMLLTPTATLDGGVRSILVTNKTIIHEVRFLGGTGAVSPAVRTAVTQALQ